MRGLIVKIDRFVYLSFLFERFAESIKLQAYLLSLLEKCKIK